MPGGRPTKYNSEQVQRVYEYLEQCKDEEYDWTKSQSSKGTSWEHRIRVNLPSIEGFALWANLACSTVFLWKTKYPEFSEALEIVKKIQKQRLIANGLSGDYNPTIAKLVLSSNHGVSEKQEIDHTSKGERISGFNYLPPTAHEGNKTDNQADDQTAPSVAETS